MRKPAWPWSTFPRILHGSSDTQCPLLNLEGMSWLVRDPLNSTSINEYTCHYQSHLKSKCSQHPWNLHFSPLSQTGIKNLQLVNCNLILWKSVHTVHGVLKARILKWVAIPFSTNCGAGEDSWESLGQQDQTSQSQRKSTLNIHWKDWCWSWRSNTLATGYEKPTHRKSFPDAGKDWRQEMEATEDEMIGWHHRLNGHEFEQTQEIVKARAAWPAALHGIAKSLTWLSDWTTTNFMKSTIFTVRVTEPSLQQIIFPGIKKQNKTKLRFFPSILLLLLSRFSCVQLCATP